MAWEYSDKTRELFMNAVQGKPGTHLGQMDDPDGFGEHGSIACGDAMQFSFRVEKDPEDPLKDVIVEAKYLTFGCTSAIASSEALCAIIDGGRFTPIEALEIDNTAIVKFLEGLPSQKIHCSVMGAEALEAAVFDWARKRGVDLRELGVDIHPHEQEEGRIVCKCFSMTEPYLRRKIKELNLRTIGEISNAVKAGGACTTCHHAPGGLQDLLDSIWGRSAGEEGAKKVVKDQPQPSRGDSEPGLSPYQFAKKVEGMIEEYVRPGLQKDGGDIEIVDIKDALVYVHLSGACAGCVGAGMTLKMMVEQTLKDKLDERIRVIAV